MEAVFIPVGEKLCCFRMKATDRAWRDLVAIMSRFHENGVICSWNPLGFDAIDSHAKERKMVWLPGR